MTEESPDFTPEDRAIARRVPAFRTAVIDAAILETATTEWKKVAYVIGHAMAEVYEPDAFVAERVRELVDSGKLESRGDMDRMHYSEVRLPSEQER